MQHARTAQKRIHGGPTSCQDYTRSRQQKGKHWGRVKSRPSPAPVVIKKPHTKQKKKRETKKKALVAMRREQPSPRTINARLALNYE